MLEMNKKPNEKIQITTEQQLFTEKKKTKESRTHHPKQNSSNVLSVSLLDQVYRLMVFQNQCFLSPCFYEDFGSIWGTLWGTILVKNQEKCVAKTAFREVAKRVRKKR